MRLCAILLPSVALVNGLVAAPAIENSASCGLVTFSSRIATPILKDTTCNKFINQNGELRKYNILANCVCFFFEGSECGGRLWTGWKGASSGATSRNGIGAYFCRATKSGESGSAADLTDDSSILGAVDDEPEVEEGAETRILSNNHAIDTIESHSAAIPVRCASIYHKPTGVDTVLVDGTCHAASVDTDVVHVTYGPHCYCTFYRNNDCSGTPLFKLGTSTSLQKDHDVSGKYAAARGYKCLYG